jgi:glucokinase
MKTAIGIDMGGTWVKGIVMTEEGDILKQIYSPTNDKLGLWHEAVKDIYHELRSYCPIPVPVLGLSAPGLPNQHNTCIGYMPGRLNGLEYFDWGKFLGQKVRVINDAHAATLAEARFGSAKGLNNVLLLTLGTGVGGGIILNGKLHQGHFQKAGHLGHMSIDFHGDRDIVGTPGSLEDAIGNASIEKRSLGRYQSTYELLEAYRQNDAFAQWLWLDSVRKLSIGLVSLTNIFSPDVIVLGGGITQAEKDLYEPLESFMALYEWRPANQRTPIVQAHFGDMAGAVGAASFALEYESAPLVLAT